MVRVTSAEGADSLVQYTVYKALRMFPPRDNGDGDLRREPPPEEADRPVPEPYIPYPLRPLASLQPPIPDHLPRDMPPVYIEKVDSREADAVRT